ncbi:hypothetical protein [Mucisphaera calidilacus]|uniref:Uncharacterized protein n=1 Tax=Mucisphaera calidilacus TaxID=2527982 RepID=A0A518BZX4_9BACT|nr:hypothetical protein [Mucisphaera calidilacus]QDU72522.1 hypothetical protein Pan265_23910 [Mucisphaera calidilacus]
MTHQHPPNDPKLEALLDEALHADETPADLTDRIMQASTPVLDQRRSTPVVAGRIRPAAWGWHLARAAAALALVAFVGWALITTETTTETPIAATTTAEEIDAIFAQLATSDTFTRTSFSEQLDDRIDTLKAEIALAETQQVDIILGENAESALMQIEWQGFVEDTRNLF